MPRRKSNDFTLEPEPTGEPVVSPIETIVAEVPKPSEFSDQITAPVTPDVEPTEPVGENGSPAPSPESAGAAPPGETVSQQYNDYVFDPRIHTPGPDGNGKKNADGKYRRKRGLGGDRAQNVSTGYDPNVVNPIKMAAAKTAAQVSVAATFVLGTIILGEEGQPIVDSKLGINEPEEMTTAYTQFYYLSEKPIEIPPWVLIGLVTTSYLARRMAMEKPRARVARVFDWCKTQTVAVFRWIMPAKKGG